MTKLLERMLRPHPRSELRGSPTSLAAAVAAGATREQQARIVDAYWALTSTVADYYLGLTEADELRKLRNEVSTYSKPLGEWQTTLATRVDTSLKAARAAQHRLSQAMGTGVMPLPTDTPFTGPYATRLDRAFPTGAPEEARLLDQLIPLRLVELQDAADAVGRSEKWEGRVTGSRGEVTGVIRALELVALNRRAFVQLARDYNLQISRYTQLTTPDRVDTPRLVAMLIRTPRSTAPAGETSLIAGESRGLDFRPGGPTRR